MDVEDYVDVLRRHRGWIIGPTFAALVISVVAAFFWPDTYISEATIRVLPPQVPEKFVASNVNTQIGQRIAAMAQSILSRARLQDLIQAYGLYPRKRNRVPMEDLIEQMQTKDIQISPVSGLREQTFGRGQPSAAFQISFAYEDRYLAQKVVQELVSRFMQESISARESQSVMTTQFLSDQVAQAKKELDAIENRLTQYKIRNAGKLPDQLESNLQQLRTLETQLASAGAAISRVSQDKLTVEAQIRVLREQKQALLGAPSGPETAVKNERLVQLEKQILNLETILAGLRQQYRETHPDVRRVEAQLAGAKKSRDELLAQEKKTNAGAKQKAETPPAALTPKLQELDAQIQQLQSLMEAKNLELERYVKEQARIDGLITQYQQRIEMSPLSEREYADLSRDYALAKARYDDLSLKKSQSEVATDLESRKQGETLELLDQASLPQKPTEPNRLFIICIGTAVGLTLGLFLAGGREMKDTSLKNLKDIRAYTNLAVLGSVPLLENDFVVRRKRRLTWLAWSTASILGFLAMAGSVYYYYTKPS